VNCPCGSGLKVRRAPSGKWWCPHCSAPRTARGRMKMHTESADRQAITRQVKARRLIEERNDMREPADALS